MRHSRSRARYAAKLALPAVALAALWASCVHDWDAYLPVAASGAAGAGGVGGQGGMGGEVPGSCPAASDGNALLKVATAAGRATCVQGREVTRGQYDAWLVALGGQGGSAGAGGAGGAGGAAGMGGGSPLAGPECDWNTDLVPAAEWPPVGGMDDERPVAHVDWCDAAEYCLGHGMRLCGAIGGGTVPSGGFANASVSEWFNACTNLGTTTYPYGNVFVATRCHAGETSSQPVASKPECVSEAGVLHLSGNVWEWEDACAAAVGPTDTCRIRGGGFNNVDDVSLGCGADSTQMRSSTAVNVGFRCCATAMP